MQLLPSVLPPLPSRSLPLLQLLVSMLQPLLPRSLLLLGRALLLPLKARWGLECEGCGFPKGAVHHILDAVLPLLLLMSLMHAVLAMLLLWLRPLMALMQLMLWMPLLALKR